MSTRKLFRRALIFAVSLAPLFASQSVVWTSGTKGSGNLPGSGSGNWWGNLASYDIEIDVTGATLPSTPQGLWEIDSNEKVFLTASGQVATQGSHGESPSLPLNGCTSFRIRFQRNTTAAVYTLELWCESTGVYQFASSPDTNTAAVNRSGLRFSIGSFYESTEPTLNFGAIRIFSVNVATGSAPPPRLLAGSLGGAPPPRARVRRAPLLRLGPNSFGDLTDFEFEGNMTDSSPLGLTFTFSSGSASYVTTPVTNPAVSQTLSTVLVGSTTSGNVISGVIAFANNDNATLIYAWTQTAGTIGTFSSAIILAPTFTPAAFGTATLQLVATDANSNATTLGPLLFGGVVLLPGTNNIDLVTEGGGGATGTQIAQLLVGEMMWGTNPWSWFDNRELVAANQQIINMPTYFPAYWLTPDSNGTISCTGGGVSATCTGSGTQFQTDFCNGGTSPANGSNTGIVIYYPGSLAISGTGYAHYSIAGCPSQTTLTLGYTWFHTTSNLVNAQYNADPTGANWANWAFSNIPANYYDNVLAYYQLWYRTGLSTYLNAAHTLASRWFSGPFWDSGMSFNVAQVSGCCIVAGPGRGISPAGVVLWGLESGTNIWPGIRYLWSYEEGLVNPNISGGQIGDIRDAAYIRSIPSLCVLYDPSPPSGCATGITNAVENWWAPLETTGVNAAPAVNNTWANTNFSNAQYAEPNGSSCTSQPCYVSVTNGSTAITLTGGTWNCSSSGGTFTNQNFATPNLLANLWFFSPNNTNAPGNSNAGDANHSAAGDSVAYTVNQSGTGCTSTTATLAVPYLGTTGIKGLEVAFYAGFGTQVYMGGISAGLSGWDYQAFTKMGNATGAALAKKQAVDLMTFIQNTGMDTSNYQLWFARTFLNCEGYVNSATPPGGWTPNNDPGCADAIVENAEIMHACVVNYQINPSPALRTFCDNTFTAMFCKAGYTCAGYSQINGTYETGLDDWPIGYQITVGPNGASTALTNKWFGYYFGIGYGDAWAVVRQGGTPIAGNSVSGAGSVAGRVVP
jgi:hypothetical protein